MRPQGYFPSVNQFGGQDGFVPQPAEKELPVMQLTPQHLMADYFREVEMMLDRSGQVVWMNRAAQELIGYTVESLRESTGGGNLSVLVEEEDQAPVRAAFYAARDERQKRMLDIRFLLRDGSVRRCHVCFIPVSNSTGRVDGVQVRGFDLTAWDHASEEVRELVAQQRILLDSLPHISLMVGGDYQIFFSNQAGRAAGLEPGGQLWEALGILSGRDNLGARVDEASRLCLQSRMPQKIKDVPYRLGLCDLMIAPCGRESFFVYVMDVTAERTAAEALDRVEKHSRLIMEVILQGILQVETDGRIIFANPAALQLSGYSGVEIAQVSFQMLFAGGASLIETRQKALASGEPVVCEETLICNDHRCVPVLLSLAPVIDSQGECQGFITSVVDISQRKKNEEERARLSAAVTQTDEAILIVEESNRVVYVNPAFERLTGYSEEEVIGKSLDFYKSNEHEDAAYREMRTAISEGRAWSGRVNGERKGGASYVEHCVVSPVYDPQDGQTCFVLFKRDISDHVKKDEQYRHLQKMNALGRLAGGVAHDFNNLLQGIFGLCDVMLMHVVDPHEYEQCVREIREEARRGSELARQLLAFSRKERQTFTPVNLNQIVEEQRKMLKRLIGRNIKLVLDLDEEIGPISAVPAQMEQVLMNLCVNAKDAMPKGGVLTLSSSVVDASEVTAPERAGNELGQYVCLSVRDTGIGMDAEVLDHLFEPFFTTKPKDQGTGLGLSLVFGIVDQHGGWVVADSQPGEGSVFRVCLPLADVEPGSPDECKLGNDQLCERTGQGEYVLLIDDDPMVRKCSIRALEKAGFHVACAENGQQARRFFERDKDKIDLLFTDIIMPGQNGYELAREFVEEKPDLPVILCSGYHESVVSAEQLRIDGFRFLQKPFSVREMLDVVKASLTNSAE